MNKEKYLIDKMPISARGLIILACEADEKFSRNEFKLVSKAAHILRNIGHDIEENENYHE